MWLDRAEEYKQSLAESGPVLSPAIDGMIESLAELRLPTLVFEQAKETANIAVALLHQHERQCTEEEGANLAVLEPDLKYAAYMHDWYRNTDPSRLLTLASEWNLEISGEEWSNPRLLQGRLAAVVLKRMYDAERVLGKRRFDRIHRMVENCVCGKAVDQCTAIEKVFFLANSIAEVKYRELHLSEIHRRSSVIENVLSGDLGLRESYLQAIQKQDKGLWNVGYVQPQPQHEETNTKFPPTTEPPE